MVAIAVDEEALVNLAGVPEPVKEIVGRVLETIKTDKSTKHFEPQTVLSDDAPSKVKNEVSEGRGRIFHIGVKFDDDTTLFMAWYEPYDRSMIAVYDIRWPVNVEIIDQV